MYCLTATQIYIVLVWEQITETGQAYSTWSSTHTQDNNHTFNPISLTTHVKQREWTVMNSGNAHASLRLMIRGPTLSPVSWLCLACAPSQYGNCKRPEKTITLKMCHSKFHVTDAKNQVGKFIQQGLIKLIKVTVKNYALLQRFISNKCCSFEIFINQRILKQNHSFHKNITQHRCFQHW